jgi:prepilin-type N-terminal cleavage/methylation domain-containing protein
MAGNRLPERLAAGRHPRAAENSIMPALSATSPSPASPAPARTPCRRGFSLLEMLVVVALIGILLGISTTILAGMKEKARAAVTRDTAKQLAEAWTRLLQDHGEWPAEIMKAGDGEVTAGSSHLKILGGFFETREKEREKGLKDSWGNLFKLWFDTDYDGRIIHPALGADQRIRASVVVASPGKDGKWGTKDDIVVY